MATVSEILKHARTSKNITLAQVEQTTKIRTFFLECLEKGDYKSLPSPYVRGFVKNYAEFLGLEIPPLLALLRRELHEKTTSVLPKSIDIEDEFPLKRIRLTGVFLLLLLIAIALSFYLFFQYKGFLGNPTLNVDTPSNNQVIKEQSLVVAGKTDPENAIKINGEFVEVLKDGSFRKTLNFFKGKFTITVTATNRFGKQTEITRTITVE